MQQLSSPSVALVAPTRLHRAARLEDAMNRLVSPFLRRRGWRPRVIPYTGYGTNGTVRVLARLLLEPPRTRQRDVERGRGWRRFLAITAPGVAVAIEIGGRTEVVTTARGGYIDAVVNAELRPGWTTVTMSAEGSTAAAATVRIIGPHDQLGLLSDIDDTVMITALPRPLVALWNTFVRREAARRPVPGLADLFREVTARNPDALVVYLSTGPWNVAPALEQFLTHKGFPRGPLLLSDWGPTPESWFRSGREHKRTQLRRLLADLPQVRWLLVGDDGQHDPQVYGEVAAAMPERVAAIAIRQLTPSEQVLTHGSPEPLEPRGKRVAAPASVTEVRGPDGFALLAALRARGLLDNDTG